jgi:hypothetical protein
MGLGTLLTCIMKLFSEFPAHAPSFTAIQYLADKL